MQIAPLCRLLDLCTCHCQKGGQRISSYRFIVSYFTVNTGQVDFDSDRGSLVKIVSQRSKQQYIGTFTAAVDAFSCDYVATEVTCMNGDILVVNFYFVHLNFVNR